MTRQASAEFSDVGRRRFPRLDVDGTLGAQDVTAGIEMHILDVGLGGFRTVSPVPIDLGTRHTFEVALEDQRIALSAQVVHCRRTAGRLSPFAIGWQWTDGVATERGIVQLLNYLTNWASFLPDIDAAIVVLDDPDEDATHVH